jgi:hypothetical protein
MTPDSLSERDAMVSQQQDVKAHCLSAMICTAEGRELLELLAGHDAYKARELRLECEQR